MKIIRDEKLDDLSWDENGINEWSTASLQYYLNEEYINELDEDMIENAKWYTSSYDPDGATSSIAYTAERASTTTQFSDGITRNTNWTGKIALAYPSDYGYASSACYAGSKDIYNYDDSTCYESDWMFNSVFQWLLSPPSDYGGIALFVISGGDVVDYCYVNSTNGVRPVTYLKSSVAIVDGSGEDGDPYILG